MVKARRAATPIAFKGIDTMAAIAVKVPATNLLKMSLLALDKLDYARMYEIAEAVAKNPARIADFDANPEAAARKINGFQLPPGFHMHIVDAANTYHPAEDDALTQIAGGTPGEAWSRIEVRAGYENFACIVCILCK